MLIIDEYIYKFSKDNEPVANVKPGDIILFNTIDCFGKQILSDSDTLEHVDWNRVNPATGPVYIEGAEPGDVIAVDILEIEIDKQGVVCTIPGCGPFAKKSDLRTHIIKIEDGYAKFKDLSWEIKPMVGVIGCAHDEKEISTGFVGNHGGNMDSSVITKGATVYLPVRVTGGLLAMGDLHATMADGEVIGCGIEIGGSVTVRVRLIKNFELNWAVTETKDNYFVNTCGTTCDEAIRHGYIEIHRLISNAYGWDYTDTAMYMTMQGSLSANQACLESEAGGNSFRIGTPKVPNKNKLIE